jgi:hypothetical protein
MNERQLYALTHPLNGADADIAPYRSIRQHGDGTLLVVVLAVDR